MHIVYLLMMETIGSFYVLCASVFFIFSKVVINAVFLKKISLSLLDPNNPYLKKVKTKKKKGIKFDPLLNVNLPF